MSSAICFNLDQSKISSPGNRLIEVATEATCTTRTIDMKRKQSENEKTM